MDEDDHHKEVYAHFGLAVYQAQVLETGLINALVALEFFPNNERHFLEKIDWSETFDAFYDGRARLTMGKLIKSLRTLTDIPEDLEAYLITALDERNFLIHHYFREKIHLFNSGSGRDAMIDDFKRRQAAFIVADRRLDEIVMPVFARYGLTAEKIEAHIQDLKEKGDT